MGNSSQGVVLSGQTQGVRQGVGVIIAADGTISFDSTTATGVLKTNNPTAYNSYVWPTTLGVAGQQLQLGAAGALSWEDPDQIPWTAKGQLIVGTGVGTSTILNVGVDGSILIADSTQTSGLGYTTNFVATTSSTGAANIPAGPVGSRPGSPISGQFRFSTTSGEMEFWDGTSWQTVAANSTGLFVEKTSTNGSAVIPAGTTAQRDSSPAAGFFRYNSDTTSMEYWNGTTWVTSGTGTVSSVTGTLPITVATGTTTPVIAINPATQLLTGSVRVATTAEATTGTDVATALSPGTGVAKDAATMTGSAYLPAGSTAQRPAAATYTGQFRYNTQIPQLEYSDGTTWSAVGGGGGGTAATLPEAQAGTLNTVFSSPLTSVPKDASGMTGSAYIPAGTTLQRPTATNYTGQFRYNTTIPQLEYSDGTTWVAVVPPGGGVTSFSGGTTGLTPAAATSGAVTLGGTLAVANGGTGATTQAAALTNLLPSQTGNSGKFLTTDGTTPSWATAGGGGGGTYPPSVGTTIFGGYFVSNRGGAPLDIIVGSVASVNYSAVSSLGVLVNGGGAPGTYTAVGGGTYNDTSGIAQGNFTTCWVRTA